MAVAGRLLLIFGLITCLYGIGASVYGARAGGRAWVDSGRRAMYALAGMAAIAFVILDVAFITSDFSYNIVATGSSTTTPLFYRAAAIWATQQGSLLLWVLLLSSWSSLALFLTRRKVPQIVPYAQAVLFTLCLFFVGLNVLFANPFATSANPPTEGAGLDPLLRHTTMMVHPPMLYSGYTLLLVPFAFALGALISGRLSAEWIQVTRRFALAAWLCLGIGILLGARWSYTELGWGGYWAWDPVENAALMPWLCATAFIHSIMIQEKRGMLKVWNVSLILTTGTLAIVGTFLVRSGILSSIHAFVSDPTLNISFVVLISAMVISSLSLVIWRRDSLQTEARLDSLISREAVFLFQNLVLVALTAVIFWITFFPLISEAITGTEVSVGPPAFRPYVVPLAIVVVLLSGIGPIIAWRRVTVSKLKRSFAFPVAAMLVAAVVLLAGPRRDRPQARAADVLRRDVRGCRRRSGILPRRQGPSGDDVGVGAGGPRPAGAPQPAAVWRLHRPRRGRDRAGRRRRLDLVPALADRDDPPGSERDARRLPVPLRAADRDRLGPEADVRRDHRRQ